MNDYFIAIYTNAVKDYCDKEFFERIRDLSNGNQIHVIDNTSNIIISGRRNRIKTTILDSHVYFEKLKQLCNSEKFNVYHIDVPIEPKISQMHRNIAQSANFIRDIFLKTNLKKFLIIESDVIPPVDLLNRFDKDIETLPSDWGMLGALYYDPAICNLGFHRRDIKGLQRKQHVLSGCTVYKRELIEKYPFRYDEKQLNAFPDAFIAMDSNKEYSLWDDHDIICGHLSASNGIRMSKPL